MKFGRITSSVNAERDAQKASIEGMRTVRRRTELTSPEAWREAATEISVALGKTSIPDCVFPSRGRLFPRRVRAE